MSDVFNRNLCSSPALHQQRLREVFQTSTADWVQFISASLLISDKIKRVESVIPTVANKRNYLRPTVNTYLCSKTVACKKSIMSQLCPKLRPLFFQKSSGRSSETPAGGLSKTRAVVRPKLRLLFLQNSNQHSNGTRAVNRNIWLPFVWNSGRRSSEIPAAFCLNLRLQLLQFIQNTAQFIWNFGRQFIQKLWPRLSVTSTKTPAKIPAAVRPKMWPPFVQNSDHCLFEPLTSICLVSSSAQTNSGARKIRNFNQSYKNDW